MDTQRFWQEEMRCFPHGGDGAAVWVVRQDGGDPAGPLRLLFGWAVGNAAQADMARTPPLTTLLRALAEQKEELHHRRDDAALWVEPIACGETTRGCLGIWFEASRTWRESIFLWGQRLAARLGPVLGQLRPWLATLGGAARTEPTLFPLPPVAGQAAAIAGAGPAASGPFGTTSGRAVALPRPTMVPGIPGCVGTSREMRRLGERLPGIAASGVNVLLHGESGTGKEIVARALHDCSDRRRGPFVGQNCAALPEQAKSISYCLGADRDRVLQGGAPQLVL